MQDQKLETLLNVSLSAGEEERDKSKQLLEGYDKERKRWELIVKYNGDISRYRSDFIQIEELIAGYAIVTLPEDLIEAFAGLEEVEYVEKPKRLYFAALQGKQASCIPEVTLRAPFLTGKGVLIAVLDSGIDYQSPEFRNRDGSSRIRYLWDQTLLPSENVGGPPSGFAKGVEFDSRKIEEALQSSRPEEIVPSFDTSGHGTAVAAVAAAGGSFQDGRFQGVAPESELIVVKLGTPAPDSFPKTTELMRGLTYAVKKAVELAKPIAINLSFGNTYGSHDGTSLLERFLDNIAEIGRTVICVGSGNEGAAGGHVAGSFLKQRTAGIESVGAQGMPERKKAELNVGSYQTSFSIQLWKSYEDRFQISLISPSGIREEINSLKPGMQVIFMEQTKILLFIGEPSPYSVNQEIYFDFLPLQRYVDSGIWTLELVPLTIVSGNFDLYLPGSAVLNADTRFFAPTPDKTLTIPSTASKVITVGAYDANYESYAAFSGRGYRWQEGEKNGRSIKPDIAAPGVNITTIAPGGIVTEVSGTSFAAPFVTGSAALLMEWGIVQKNDPFLYGEKVKAYLRKGAKALRGEKALPNDKVGFGALCVEKSLPL